VHPLVARDDQKLIRADLYAASAGVAGVIVTDRGRGDRRGENLSARLMCSMQAGRGATVSAADTDRKPPRRTLPSHHRYRRV
jgi:hypothetical protein